MHELDNVTVVLAEDHAMVREGIAALCAGLGMQVLGQCADGLSALKMITALKPDFAILDMNMPGMTGLEAIRKLRAAHSKAKLMVLSINRDDSAVLESLRAGADAYLVKEGPMRHLVDAIRYVREGGVYVSPLLLGVGLFATAIQGPPHDPLASLSPRELEVLACLVNGMRSKDIGSLLEISPKTVDAYRASLMRKLGVHDMPGLVKLAIERHLTSSAPNPWPRLPGSEN